MPDDIEELRKAQELLAQLESSLEFAEHLPAGRGAAARVVAFVQQTE